MYFFHNDYNQAAHPDVLKKMMTGTDVQHPGYGMDDNCSKAAALIREHCCAPNASVHFLVGGTQTNLAVITAALRPHQAVLGVDTAHVNVHETGAIEATGHKVVALASEDGKITAKQVRGFAQAQSSESEPEHAVQVKMVYISHPTELGTTYTLSELEQISETCKEFGLYLYLDGARLGYALAAEDNDIELQDLARLCDVFYIGGTKVGAMFGEAVVFTNQELARDFRYIIKQRGAMLAKGWLLGKQFEALFENGLYTTISAYANKQADRIRATLKQCGYPLLVPCSTNQTFAILPDGLLAEIDKDFSYMVQEKRDDGNTVVRFCTSWATDAESVTKLCQVIFDYKQGGCG